MMIPNILFRRSQKGVCLGYAPNGRKVYVDVFNTPNVGIIDDQYDRLCENVNNFANSLLALRCFSVVTVENEPKVTPSSDYTRVDISKAREYYRELREEIERRIPGFPIVLHGSSSVPQEYVDIINTHGGKLPDAVGQDSENPVYYVQYAHARICTLLAAMAEAGCAVPAAADVDAALLTTPQERELIKQLAMLPEEIHLAARDYDPSRINRYVTELAARFHRFYNVCRIKDAEPAVRDARLKLADTTRRVLEIGLGIIGVTAPEKM